MSREVLELAGLDEAKSLVVSGPVRLAFLNPRRGGPRLANLRGVLQDKGRLRFSGTPLRIFVDIDPGPSELPVIGLDMIARSDASGLERAILSALGEVDEIVVGIDERSDEETRRVAEAYANVIWSFFAEDLELTDEEWKANKIHFANARNLGRKRVGAPWTLVLDTDEYLAKTVDLRETVLAAGPVGAFAPSVQNGAFTMRDPQRLAHTSYRWWSASHNQLSYDAPQKNIDAVIVHDTSLRAAAEIARRTEQRKNGVHVDLSERAEKGDLVALFHLAKQLLGENDEEGVKRAQEYRFKAEVHGPLADERAWIALGCASLYYNKDNFVEAELWALRVMLDGPRQEAFCILGDIAEDRGDLAQALVWYEAACITPETGKVGWPGITNLRWGRREGLRRALVVASAGQHPEAGSGQAEPESQTDPTGGAVGRDAKSVAHVPLGKLAEVGGET